MTETEVQFSRAEFERLLQGVEKLVGDHGLILAAVAENRAILEELRRIDRRLHQVEDEQHKCAEKIA